MSCSLQPAKLLRRPRGGSRLPLRFHLLFSGGEGSDPSPLIALRHAGIAPSTLHAYSSREQNFWERLDKVGPACYYVRAYCTRVHSGGKMGRPTRDDVARQAQVSGATVSRVLSGKEDVPIAEETRVRVLAAARKVGYQPNPAAR